MGSGGGTAWLNAQSEGTYFHGGAYHTDNINADNVFIGNYVESGQASSQFTTPTLIFG